MKTLIVSTTAKALDGSYKVKVDKLAEGVNLARWCDIRKVKTVQV